MNKIGLIAFVGVSAILLAGCDAQSVGTNEKLEQNDDTTNVTIEGTLKNGSGVVIYDGQLVNGEQHGFGISYSDQGKKKYEGNREDGEAKGQGKLYYESNGQVQYNGEFHNGKPEGQGVRYYQNGAVAYHGMFDNGKPEGQGKLLGISGNVIFEGEFTGQEIKFEDILPK